MKHVETLGYSWCFWEGSINEESEFEFVKTLSGNWMVYCRMEKFYSSDGGGGFRTVPVKREDIDIIHE